MSVFRPATGPLREVIFLGADHEYPLNPKKDIHLELRASTIKKIEQLGTRIGNCFVFSTNSFNISFFQGISSAKYSPICGCIPFYEKHICIVGNVEEGDEYDATMFDFSTEMSGEQRLAMLQTQSKASIEDKELKAIWREIGRDVFLTASIKLRYQFANQEDRNAKLG